MSTLETFEGRTFLLERPKRTINKKRPLLIVLHGGMGNAKTAEKNFGFSDAPRGFYIAYPNGTAGLAEDQRTWNAGTCCGAAVSKAVDDSAWLRGLTKHLTEEEGVDEKNVDVVGFSNGAMMAYRLACEAPGVYRNVGAVAGTLCIDDASGAKETQVLHVHGGLDANVPYWGGKGDGKSKVAYRSVPESMQLLLAPRGAQSGFSTASAALETHKVVCSEGAAVTWHLVHGMAHEWPKGAPLDATQEILTTFGLH